MSSFVMRRAVWGAAVASLCSVAPGCGSSPSDERGSAEVFAVTSSALTQADVARVALTISGAGIDPALTSDLAKVGNKWQGVIGGIPAGTERTFHGDAFDATPSIIYAGETPHVTIVKGQKAIVGLILQQTRTPDPFHNSAPQIDSIYAGSDTVEPGGTLSLTATYSDPDLGDVLTASWSSPDGGTFAAPGDASTTWTAPATEGAYTLRLSVRDSKGASAAISFVVQVRAGTGTGSASVTASFNDAPLVETMTTSANPLAVGGATQLGLTTRDIDDDAVTGWEWEAAPTCTGAFDDNHLAAPTFTLQSATASSCAFTVKITDARGGWNTGMLSVPVGTPAPVGKTPVVDTSFQGADVADGGASVPFRAKGHDPAGGALTYSWAATAGSVGTATTNAAGESEVVWTAPTCFTGDAVVSVTMTSASGTSTTQAFTVTAGAAGLCDLRSIRRANVRPDGGQADWDSYTGDSRRTISGDGRFVVFTSYATDLTADVLDTYTEWDGRLRSQYTHVYVRDLETGTTKLVDTRGNEAHGATGYGEYPSISSDGRFVAFRSSAGDLIAGGNGQGIYVRDMLAASASFVRADVPAPGGASGYYGNQWRPVISADGTHVCFTSYDALDPADTNSRHDVYVRDLVGATTRRVSTGSFEADWCAMSANGEVVTFTTSSHLVLADVNNHWDVYARNMTTGALTLVSGGGVSYSVYGDRADVSADGSKVVFSTYEPLLPEDTDGRWSIYVRDLATNGLRYVNADIYDAYYVSFSATSNRIAFVGQTVSTNIHGVYTLDLATSSLVLQSVDALGTQANDGNVQWPVLSADGRYVTFMSYASNLVPDDTNGNWDIFVAPVR